MKLVFADQPLPLEVTKTIFLAGPNPRYKDGDKVLRTWRHDMLDELEAQGYDGHVFIPTPIGSFYGETIENAVADYDHQIDWEDSAMGRADVILLWMDRTDKLPGMTSNIEFGRYLDSGRLVYGHPPEALNVRYLDEQTKKRRREAYTSISEIVRETLWRLRDGAEREGGQVLVPLVIWKSKQFQNWYTHMFHGDSQGNELRGFDVKSIICFNTRRSKITDERELFSFTAAVNIYVKREDREKSNEWVFSRTDTSYVVPYYIDPETGRRSYVLVREFRSPANNESGYVYEFPGGSAPDGNLEPRENARQELKEETGIEIEDISRFVILGNRQTFSTFSLNRIFAVGLELREDEFKAAVARSESKEVLGADEGERIQLFIADEYDLLSCDSEYPVDYSTLGMIHLSKSQYRPESKAQKEEESNPFFN